MPGSPGLEPMGGCREMLVEAIGQEVQVLVEPEAGIEERLGVELAERRGDGLDDATPSEVFEAMDDVERAGSSAVTPGSDEGNVGVAAPRNDP